MADVKCKKCNSLVGDRNAKGELSLRVNRINMHYPVKIQSDGETQMKCRSCSTIIDITQNGVTTNEKAGNRNILDNFGKRQAKGANMEA